MNDANAATIEHCEVQLWESAPTLTVRARSAGTRYHAHLKLDNSLTPGSSQIYNNHIPVDPDLQGVLSMSKTTPMLNVTRGQLVPYIITYKNITEVPLFDVRIIDRIPAGFRYVEGSARIDGVPTEPELAGREIIWNDLAVDRSASHTLLVLLAVGAGVGEGEFVNRVQAVHMLTGGPLSNEASATVRVVPDPTFDCTDVTGKVFDDANRSGYQDAGEQGLPGVRLVTARGLTATTDGYGRFHITCAITPREGRGSNFILKLDDRTLPSGFRASTEEVRVQRATRGKALRFNFGASIHRVIGLDLADAVFEPGTTEMRSQWKPRMTLLLTELQKSPAVLRLSYLADLEDEGLVEQRLERRQGGNHAVVEDGRLRLSTHHRAAGVLAARCAAKRSRRARANDQVNVMWKHSHLLLVFGSLLAAPSQAQQVEESSLGEAVERHLPNEEAVTQWTHDPERINTDKGDELRVQPVFAEQLETVKLTDVIPPIRFESGVANIPPGYIDSLRKVLDGMRERRNVRLHLIGHADDQPLSDALAAVYKDNAGLSRERAGEVAEFLQNRLNLRPEAVSYEWAGDTRPIATNATAEGRALNRRVEVEVWYDEVQGRIAEQEVLVQEDFKRIKVCRVETVCKMRFKEGHARRARVKNLVPPLRFEAETTEVSPQFIEHVGKAWRNLANKQNVVVKFIGYTDDQPLTGRDERIYGDHLALSKARAHRVALAVQEALSLPTAAISSDGRGASMPLAANDSASGRALNRRIEVEFWHDDPLQELPDEPQLCPDAAGSEMVTKVYEPSWGRIAPLQLEQGRAVIPPGYTDDLRRAMTDISDKTNVRLRFIGYTKNESLDRRTASVYGDDIGLSAARARRAMATIKEQMQLSDAQAEHEGRGYRAFQRCRERRVHPG